MNKNTKRIKTLTRSFTKKNGGFGKPVYKKKAKPFPKPNPDEDLRMSTQDKIYYGACSLHNKS